MWIYIALVNTTHMKNIFDLKTFVTVALTATITILAITGRMTTSEYLPIVTMVYTYYFTREKKGL